MVARILALVAAVGLVAGAVALRGAIEGDDASAGDDARIAIWCDPLLADACTSAADGAEVEMIEPGDAFKRLADPQNDGPAPSLWVTAGDWPAALAAANPNTEIPTFGAATPAASSPLVAAAKGANLALIDSACGQKVTWTCLAESAGRQATDLGGSAPLGEFRLGHVVPPSSLGLATLAALLPTVAADPDAPNRGDVDSQAYRGLLDRVDSGELGIATGAAVSKFLTQPGEASVFIGPEAALVTKAEARGFELVTVEPSAALTAQVAPLKRDPAGDGDAPSGDAVAGFADRLGDRLSADGWGEPTPEAGTDPGVLAALLDAWNDR